MSDNKNSRFGILSLTAHQYRNSFKNILEFYLYSISVLTRFFSIPRKGGVSRLVLFRQILFTGCDALALMGFIAISTSALVILEVHQIMGQLGEGGLIHELIVVIVIRQLSSLFVALVVIARSGAAISTELGNMVVHQEIDLLHSFGISPLSYLVIPRVVGVVVSVLTLTLYFNFIAIVGGALFANFFYGMPVFNFIHQVIREMSFLDLLSPVIKSFLFGLAIGLISCFQGLKVKGASTEVPQRAIHSVVNSVMATVVLNIFVTLLEFL